MQAAAAERMALEDEISMMRAQTDKLAMPVNQMRAAAETAERDAANTARIAYGLRRQATEALVALQDEEDRRQMKAALARWASEQARRSSGLPNLRTFQDFRISEVRMVSEV